MSSTANASGVRLPLRVVLILAICACSLAVHFIAEGLAPAGGQFMFELPEQAETAHPVHEHSEDQFVFSFLRLSPLTELFLLPPLLTIFCLPSFSISPLLPPPNS